MDLLLDQAPITNTGLVVQLTVTPQTLDELGITPDPSAKIIRFYYDPAEVEIIARYSHDANFNVTDAAGIPVAPLDIHFYNEHMFLGVTIRAITGTVDVMTEQFSIED